MRADTGRAMSQENVEALQRGIEAFNRRDVEGFLGELDAEVEFHAAIPRMLGGEVAVYWGHEAVRELLLDLDSTLAGLHIVLAEIKDLGERIVGLGHFRVRGKASGAEVESPYGVVVDFKHGKAIRVRDYLDHREALEAAGPLA